MLRLNLFQINRYTGQNNDKLRWIANITQQVNDILLNVRKLQEPLKLQDETLDRSIGETNGNLQVCHFLMLSWLKHFRSTNICILKIHNCLVYLI